MTNMSSQSVRSVFLCALGLFSTGLIGALAGIAQSPAKKGPEASPVKAEPATPSTDAFASEAEVFELVETGYRMHADGTGERTLHVIVKIQSDAAARQFGVLNFSFAASSETPHITAARVYKPDGSVVDTPVADAIDMPAAVSREAPLYSDLKEKHLPVRSLSVGDRLEYEVHTSIDKAETPGQFWGAFHFSAPGTEIVLAEVLDLEVPKDKYVQVWSPNHKPETTEQDGMMRYRWKIAQLTPAPKPVAPGGDPNSGRASLPKDVDEDADGRKLPSIAWTTFHNWAEVGDWYRGLSLGRTEPTDALRAKAAEISAEAKTPEEQVRAIYNFVSLRTRYIGNFGIGRYQPHGAAEVLANQYGDCKDKDTLLESLLRAKGFSTAPALIGAGITPVSEVPSPAVFNHVITTVNLPEGRIWLDSTPEVAQYRLLSPVIRDEQALVVPANAPATLERTPVSAPYPLEEHFEAVAELDAEGKLTGKIAAQYHDDNETVVRSLARNVAPAQWDQASQYISQATGFGGTTSHTKFVNNDGLSQPIEMDYEYERHPFGDWDNKRIVPLLPALEFLALSDDEREPEADIELGAPRKLVAVSRIQLPKGFMTDLPDAVHVKTDFATVDKTYRFDGQEVVVERTVVVLKKNLPKSEWKRYATFSKDIGLSGENWIQLIPPSRATVTVEDDQRKKPDAQDKTPALETRSVAIAGAAGKPSPNAAVSEGTDAMSPDELMQRAREQMQSGDMSGAAATLDKLKAKSPEQENLWSAYGAIARQQGKMDEAKSDFRKEVTSHPNNAFAVGALAATDQITGDAADARKTVQRYVDHHPENLQMTEYLAALETQAQDHAAALKTLQAAADQHADDRMLKLQIGEALMHLDRKEEAAAAAKSALDGADDAGVMNSGAYELAEAGLNLSYAEEVVRKSIAKLEEQSAAITPTEANSRTFAQANLLMASWDTLGWVLFREGKAAEAKDYIYPAWRNRLEAELGEHLGEVDEALGDKDGAYAAFSLAGAASNRSTPAEIREQIAAGAGRLKAAGANESKGNGADILQNSRTYRLPYREGASGWGTFRLQITTAGVVAAQQMTGDKKLEGLLDEITKMKFPELLPAGSKAKLLRSAVVSCSASHTCELVLVPNGGLHTEQN